jgi:hypothetical protein
MRSTLDRAYQPRRGAESAQDVAGRTVGISPELPGSCNLLQPEDNLTDPSARYSPATPAMFVRQVIAFACRLPQAPLAAEFPVPVDPVLLSQALVSPFSGPDLRARLTAILEYQNKVL